MDVCSIVPVQTAPIEPTLLEAEVATAALLDDRHAGQLYELTGVAVVEERCGGDLGF